MVVVDCYCAAHDETRPASEQLAFCKSSRAWSASQPDLSSHWHLHLSLTFSLKICWTKGSGSAFFGQGATGKTRAEASPAVHGSEET